MIDTVIVDAARTPVGRKMGKLAGAHPTDTLGHVMMKMLERQGLEVTEIARQLKMGQGEIRLILGLNKKLGSYRDLD